jgi:hypothetical protein
MAVICISRELASYGEETAQELAKLNGYKIVDKEHIEAALSAIGIDIEKQERYDEKNPVFGRLFLNSGMSTCISSPGDLRNRT